MQVQLFNQNGEPVAQFPTTRTGMDQDTPVITYKDKPYVYYDTDGVTWISFAEATSIDAHEDLGAPR